MALREFRDRAGLRWRAWDVHPGAERPGIPSVHPHGPEAEPEALFSDRVRRQFAEGWLAFETAGERRRLAPIPPGWEELPEDKLRELCERAARLVAVPAM